MRRFLAVFLVVLLLVPNMVLAVPEPIQGPGMDLLFFEDLLKYIEERHPFPTDRASLIQGGIKGILQSVDPYSDYYTPEEAEELYRTMEGEFSGIGVYIEEKDGYINISQTIKGQPAERAGLKKDDLIISVEGEDIRDIGIRRVSSMIKGPVGSKVTLGIKRGEEILSFEITRDTISVNPVEYKILDKDIGYIKLKEFTDQTTKETRKVLGEFDSKGVERLILDLRDNPGGLLNEAISISRLFIPRGPIVHIKEKNKALVTYVSKLEKPKYKLVVLVNENSASASEIVAGGIQNRKAGSLVGTKTLGKGTVQSMAPLTDGSIVKLTIAEYLLPDKTSINGRGIEPDHIVENTGELDLQLEKAIGVIRQ